LIIYICLHYTLFPLVSFCEVSGLYSMDKTGLVGLTCTVCF